MTSGSIDSKAVIRGKITFSLLLYLFWAAGMFYLVLL
jgi:hypothetical protein